jgi:hypothetical protein
LIRLNTFHGAFAKVPAAQDDHDWPELVAELEALTRNTAREKTRLPAFTLGTLTEAYNVNANYADHTALAIDVDSCPQETLDALDALGLAIFAYASPSDPNPDGTRRVRIVAQLSEPIAPEHVRHARRAFSELLDIGPGCGVETADAVSQIMFAGRLQGTPVRETWQTEGEPLDAQALVATPLTRQWRKASKASAVAPLERLAVADADERTAALLEALALHWADGEVPERRKTLRALGGYLARRGWPDDQIAAVAVGLAPDRPVTNRVALMVECARAARLDDNAAGWSSLAEWSPDAAAVIESVAKDPREPVGFVGVWAPCLARMFERVAAQAAAEAPEAFAPAAAAPEGDPIFLVSRKSSMVLIRESDELGHRPIHEKRVRLRVRELDYHIGIVELFAKGGKPLSTDAILEKNGRSYTHTAYAFANRVTTYDPTGEGKVTIGYPLTPLEARFDADADAWLRALGGEHYDRLAVWIASCAQVHINRLSACLIVMGRADSGKSMLGHAVARMWGQTPPALALTVVQFNADLLRCPILVDEEAQLFGSKALSTKRFRDVIQSVGRSVEFKGLERCELTGALRAIVSCNGYSDLRFADLGGPAVIEALRDRMLVLDATERAEACKGPLVRLRLPNDHRVDLDRVARHMMWLCETVMLPAERFLGAGGDESEGAILRGHVEENADVFETFRDWLESEGPGGAWSAHRGQLCAEPKALAMALERTGKGWDLARVRAALAPFHVGSFRPRDGARPRLWALDGARLSGALGLDGEGREALERRMADEPDPQPRVSGRFGPAR